MADQFYTVSAVAEMLCVTEHTIREWLKEGKLRYARLGGRTIRIRQSALDDFITDVIESSVEEPA